MRTVWKLRAVGALALVGAVIAAFAGSGSGEQTTTALAQTAGAVTLHAPETLRANGADLRWTPYTGIGFTGYEVHRATSSTFTPGATTLLTTIKDPSLTVFQDTTAAPSKTFTYKIVTAGITSAGRTVALPASGTATKTLQPAGADGKATFMQKATSGSVSCNNSGARDKLFAGAQSAVERSLVQFDISDLPAGATVTSASLSFYRETTMSRALSVDAHPVRGEWKEGTGTPSCSGTGASWDETEGGMGWEARGGDFVPTASASVTLASGAAPGWDTFDVKSVAQDWANGKSPNLGLLLRLRDETLASGNIVSYLSDDNADPTRRPTLTIAYTDPSAISRGPSVDVSSPEDATLVNGSAVTLTAAAGDDRRVDQVQFLVDGVLVGTDTAAPWSVTWNSTTATNANHTFKAKATDDVGNVVTSAGVSATVGNSATPSTRVTSPSSSYHDVVGAAAPAGYWRLGESAGTIVADSSGNGRNGALSGTYVLGQASLLTGDANSAAKLQNATTDGRVGVTGLSGVLGSSVTAEVWADTTTVASTAGISRLLSRGWGGAGGWRLGVGKGTDGQQRLSFTVNVAGVEKTAEAIIAPGRHHLAGRYSGSAVGVFVDGVYKGGIATGTQALNTTATAFIGETLLDDVVIDEAAVYPAAMAVDEGRRHWEIGTARTPTIDGSDEKVVGAASDDRSISKVEFYLDGERFGTDSTVPYDAGIGTGDVAQPVWNGIHTVTTKAYDDHDQETDSSTSTIRVDNTGGDSKYAAAISSTAVPQAVEYNPALATQLDHGLDVTVRNDSAAAFSSADVVIRPRWIPPDASQAIVEQPEVALAANLAAGQSATRRVMVKPPALPAGVTRAQWTLRVDLYSKSGASYFAAKGNKPHDNPVIVDKSLAGNLGLERFWHYDREQLGGGMEHLTNVANGNSVARLTPFTSTGRGLSTVLDLTYNALEQKSDSPLGANWSLSISGLTRFGNPLDVHPNKADEIAGRGTKRNVDIVDGDGTTHRFTGKVATDGTVYWEEPAGVHLYLRSLGGTDPARKWALTRPDRVTFYYDVDGFPTSIEDRNGNRITYTLETTPPGEDPGGPKKRITAVADASGRAYSIQYWTKATAQKPHIRGNVRKITDHSGAETTFQYYDDGNLLRIAQTGGKRGDGSTLASRAWYFTYTTPSGDGPAIPLAADRQHPDPATRSQSTRLFSVRDPRKHETTFAYLGPGNGNDRWKLASRTDRFGATATYAYDVTNRVTTVNAPMARTSKYGYDTEGKVTRITNPNNEVTLIGWSADRHIEKITQPTGRFKEFRYDANGYLTDAWDELRNRTHLDYETVNVDANDVAGKWKTGRGIPHISQLKFKTDPKGMATAAPTDDFQWTWFYDPRGNPIKVVDPENADTEFAYNADGTISRILDPNDHPLDFPAYDPSGQPTRMLDAEGNTTLFGYDADGYLRSIQDPEHVSETGGVTREYRTELFYDRWHRLDLQSAPKSTSAARKTLIWSAVKYDANDNVNTEIAPHYGEEYTGTGATSTFQYDRMDRLERVFGSDKTVDTQGERWRFSYDDAGRLIQATDPRGMASLANDRDGATYFSYDKLDRLAREWRELLEGTTTTVKETHSTHYCYDLAGDLRAVVPPKANVTSVDCSNLTTLPRASLLDYDEAHRLRSERDALGHKRSTDYDENGRIAFRTDANLQRTTYEYDERGLRTKVIEPFETGRTVTTLRKYDPAGNLKEEVSPRGWDASADKQTFTQYKTTYEYDRIDQLRRVVMPTSTAHPGQHYVHRDYDRNGNLKTLTQPTTIASLASVPPERRTEITYWDPGWVKSLLKKPRSRVHLDYTAEGWQRLRTPEKADGSMDTARQREWVYSADGNVREERVGSEELGYAVDTFDYDGLDQLVKAHTTSGLANLVKQAAKDLTVAYDTVDRPVKVREKTDKETNWTATLAGWDPNGNLTSREENREETDAGTEVKAGRKHDFTYDLADWLDVHRDFGSSTAVTDDRHIQNFFHPTGWEKERIVKHADSTGAFQTKQTTQWEYFANGRLKTLTTRNGAGSVKESHTLGYLDGDGRYANGHRTKDTFRLDGAQTSDDCRTADCVTDYGYDARDRVVEETTRRAGTTRTTRFTLDAAGNITREERPGRTEVSEYTGDQITRQTITEGTASAAFRYHHDAVSGNLLCVTKDAGSAGDCNPAEGTSASANLLEDYAFDAEDRLTGFRRFDAGVARDTAEYVYDAFDRPVEETENHPGFATPRTTKFTYIGPSNKVSREEAYAGSATGKLDETKTFSYDAYGRRTGMSDKKEPTTAGGSPTTREYSYAYDVHGSVSLLLDDTGKAQASYGYTAYGESDDRLTREKDPTDSTGARSLAKENPLNSYRYTGKRLDSGSSTLDMGARRFGPDTTRFLQEDAFDDALDDLELSADPLTANRYALAAGNPLSFVEADGHMLARDGGGTSSRTPRRRRRSSSRYRLPQSFAGSDAAQGGYEGIGGSGGSGDSHRSRSDAAQGGYEGIGGSGGSGDSDRLKQASGATSVTGGLAEGSRRARHAIKGKSPRARAAERRHLRRHPGERAARRAAGAGGRLLGPAGIAVGTYLDYKANRAAGDSVGRSVRKAAVSGVAQGIGTGLGIAACSAASATIAGAAACPVLVAGGTALGYLAGDVANDTIDAAEPVVEDAIENAGEDIDEIDEGIDDLGDSLGL